MLTNILTRSDKPSLELSDLRITSAHIEIDKTGSKSIVISIGIAKLDNFWFKLQYFEQDKRFEISFQEHMRNLMSLIEALHFIENNATELLEKALSVKF